MSEWQLFSEGETPYFTTPDFFAQHPWIDPVHQAGHTERLDMTERVVRDLLKREKFIEHVAELGCGDGSLLERLSDIEDVHFTGYDACTASLDKALGKGLKVIHADIRRRSTDWADLVISCEVVEHMQDPHQFISNISSRFLILTSPSAETDKWHYEHHAWAWDMDGYRNMVTGAGWDVIDHVECDAPAAGHCGIVQPQRFQCLTASKEEWSA